jgi:hypothetical protein
MLNKALLRRAVAQMPANYFKARILISGIKVFTAFWTTLI